MAKTALQELIEWLDPIHESVRQKAISLLETEKRQIMNSWMDGKENKQFGYDVFDDAEKYFKITFEE